MQLGTPALVHVKQRGSSLTPKVRWGVAWGMYKEQPIWLCPFTKSTFRSKSFAAFDLKDGMNYGQFLGIEEMPSIRKRLRIREDKNDVVTVQLRQTEEMVKHNSSPVVGVQLSGRTGKSQVEAETREQEKAHQESAPSLGGSIKVVDSTGNTVHTDRQTGHLELTDVIDREAGQQQPAVDDIETGDQMWLDKPIIDGEKIHHTIDKSTTDFFS